MSVKLKPLAWVESPNTSDIVLNFPLGYYVNETDQGWRINYASDVYYPSRDAAKAAAFADFEARIMSVLESASPSP